MIGCNNGFRPVSIYIEVLGENACLNCLLNAQQILEQKGCIEGKIHRFLLVAQRSRGDRTPVAPHLRLKESF
jgi:hypothetical protein